MYLRNRLNILKSFFLFSLLFFTPLSYGKNETLEQNDLPAGLQKLYEDITKLDQEDANFRLSTDLIEAVKNNDLKGAEYLIKVKKVDIDDLSGFGMTALHTAVIYNKIKMVKFLLDNGAEIHKEDSMGQLAIDLSTSDKINGFFIQRQIDDIAREVAIEIQTKIQKPKTALGFLQGCKNLFKAKTKK